MSATFEQALEAHMKNLDKAYETLRALHFERRSLNEKCTQMQDALAEFRAAGD